MKNIIKIAVIALFASSLNASDVSVKEEGVKYIKMLGKELKTNLIAHMKADPTGVNAMGFCAGKAESLTKEVNAKLPEHALVRRTALKTRSEKNSPDVTDIEVMEAYVAGEKGIKVVEKEGVSRVYKPLYIGKACMKCHADSKNISPDINAVIKKVYPKDMATGFKEGDFRGVIVAEIKR